MKKKTVPCFVAGKQKPYANCVIVEKTIYISGMNGRSSETGEAVSDTIAGQTWRALEQIDLAGQSPVDLPEIIEGDLGARTVPQGLTHRTSPQVAQHAISDALARDRP